MSAEREGMRERVIRASLLSDAERFGARRDREPRDEYEAIGRNMLAAVDLIDALLDTQEEREPGIYSGFHAACFECRKPLDLESDEYDEVNDGLAVVCSRECWERFAKRYDETASPEPDARYVVVSEDMITHDALLSSYEEARREIDYLVEQGEWERDGLRLLPVATGRRVEPDEREGLRSEMRTIASKCPEGCDLRAIVEIFDRAPDPAPRPAQEEDDG